MKNWLWLLFCAAGISAEAQVQTPASSPAGSVTSEVGLTTISVDYSRPRARGRKIFGSDESSLVLYGSIWRTGANNGTVISFSDDVKVEGIDVPKGKYMIFSWPGPDEWTISLYKDLTIGGATGKYDASSEAARFKVKPGKLTERVETFTINIGDIADDNRSAKVQLAWENTSVKFTVAVSYDEQVMKSIARFTQVNPGDYFQAAVYYLETGRDLNQALEWIEKAAAANPDAFWVSYQKALIQKALGDKTGAKATAQSSLATAKKAGNRDYQKMNEALIASLK